jgi:DNA-binding IscR family transcriptional regulator
MNSRFAVAVHVVTLIEQSRGEPVTSEFLAGSVNTNPSLVRRLLGMLAKAGLTTSLLGTGGGALLARPASEITLLDVYRAVDEGELFGMHRERPNPACPVGRNIQAALQAKLVDEMGLKPRVAFGPVRVAVTGRRVSPPLFESMELLGRDRSLSRLQSAVS